MRIPSKDSRTTRSSVARPDAGACPGATSRPSRDSHAPSSRARAPGPAVGRDERDPAANRLAGAAERRLRAVDLDAAGARAVEAEHGLEQLAAAGADEAREADDLAPLDIEIDGGDAPRQRPPRTRRTGRPLALLGRGGSISSSARPTIRWISCGRSSSASASPTVCPSRSTVTRSASSKTSCSRCETKMIPTPSSRRVRTSEKSDATSSSVSELVGSSRTRTRASIESARAISTICC